MKQAARCITEVGKLFHKGTVVGFAGPTPTVSVGTTYFCLCSRKTTIGKKRMNDCGYVLIKLSLQKQTVG